jgi:autotransporter-associated beta strand protein
MSPLLRLWKNALHALAAQQATAKRHPRARVDPRLEPLEDRLAPATLFWTGAASQFWSDPNNWAQHMTPYNTPEADLLIFDRTGARRESFHDGSPTTIDGIVFLDSGYTIRGGDLTLTGSALIGASAPGGTNTIENRTLTIPTSILVDVAPNNDLRVRSTISGGMIDFDGRGGGTLALLGNNSYVDGTTVHLGTLVVGNSTALGIGRVVLEGSTLQSSSSVTLANPLDVDVSSSISALDFGFSDTLKLTGSVQIMAGATLTDTHTRGSVMFDGVVFGPGRLTKTGTGTLYLNAANTYEGGTEVSAGFLGLHDNNSLGKGGLDLKGGTVEAVSFTTADESVPLTLANSFVVSDGNISSDRTTFNLTGNGRLNGELRVTDYRSTPSTITFSGALTGPGSLTTKDDPSHHILSGTIVLSGTAANSYSGTTTVTSGKLVLKKPAGVNAIAGRLIIGDGVGGLKADVVSLGAPNQIADNVAITINSSGLLKLNNFSDTYGPVTGTGKVVTGDPPTMTVAFDDLSATFEGAISGPGSVVKDGTGTWILSGANTYTGGTIVDGGTLLVNGSTGAVTVNAGGTLGGTGTTGLVTLFPFVANLNRRTGALTLDAGVQVLNSVLTLEHTGGYVTVNVQGAVARWPAAFVTSITINTGMGDDTVYVRSTRAPLTITSSGGSDTVNLGNDTDGVRRILGAVTVFNRPAYTALNIDNTADPIGRDVTLRSIGVFSSLTGLAPGTIKVQEQDLSALNILGGSGNNTYTIRDVPQNTIPGGLLTTLRTGTGNDLVNVGTTRNALESIGNLNIVDQGGTDQLLIRDQGTTTARRYELAVGQFVGQETRGGISARPLNGFGTVMDVVFDHVESVTLNAGSGGNLLKIAGTPAATSALIHTGAGSDTVDVGSNSAVFGTVNSLRDIRGPLMLDGQGGLEQEVTFNDQGTTTSQNYTLLADELTRTDANSVPDMAPISFAAIETVTLNGSSGGSTVLVGSTAAGVSTTVNGQPGALDTFAVGFGADTSTILGPVSSNGQAADGDFAYYYDYSNANPQTYNVSTNPASPRNLLLESTGSAPVTFNDLSEVIFVDPLVGGSAVNVKAVPAQMFLIVEAGNGDTVTMGSLAPNLGGTLANIMGPVFVGSYSPDDAVTLVLDDSGNADLTPKNVMLTPRNGPFDYGNHIEGFAPNTVFWDLGSNASVSLLGGAADAIFSLQSFVAETPLTIVGGTGSNTLDYSSYTTDVSVNLQTGTATDLAGIKDPNTGRVTIQNVIGGSGNDTLLAGADRSILIGSGGGADHLFGGSGEDILIGGITDYTQPNLNVAAIDAILQEWNRTDLSFDDRMSDLLTGSNSQGVAANNVIGGTAILFNSTTVHDDLAADALTGGTGRDWYFIDASDLITNKKPGDDVTMV